MSRRAFAQPMRLLRCKAIHLGGRCRLIAHPGAPGDRCTAGFQSSLCLLRSQSRPKRSNPTTMHFRFTPESGRQFKPMVPVPKCQSRPKHRSKKHRYSISFSARVRAQRVVMVRATVADIIASRVGRARHHLLLRISLVSKFGTTIRSAVEGRFGSKLVKLRTSKCFPVCPEIGRRADIGGCLKSARGDIKLPSEPETS
jgi:hypothetical protein